MLNIKLLLGPRVVFAIKNQNYQDALKHNNVTNGSSAVF